MKIKKADLEAVNAFGEFMSIANSDIDSAFHHSTLPRTPSMASLDAYDEAARQAEAQADNDSEAE